MSSVSSAPSLTSRLCQGPGLETTLPGRVESWVHSCLNLSYCLNMWLAQSYQAFALHAVAKLVKRPQEAQAWWFTSVVPASREDEQVRV